MGGTASKANGKMLVESSIRFIANSEISQICCIVELQIGQNVSHNASIFPFLNPAMHHVCDILLFAINLTSRTFRGEIICKC